MIIVAGNRKKAKLTNSNCDMQMKDGRWRKQVNDSKWTRYLQTRFNREWERTIKMKFCVSCMISKWKGYTMHTMTDEMISRQSSSEIEPSGWEEKIMCVGVAQAHSIAIWRTKRSINGQIKWSISQLIHFCLTKVAGNGLPYIKRKNVIEKFEKRTVKREICSWLICRAKSNQSKRKSNLNT